VERPDPTVDSPQGMCLDKGYDYDEGRELLAELGSPPTSGAGGKKRRHASRRPVARHGGGWWKAGIVLRIASGAC